MSLAVGQRVRFKAGTFKMIGREEMPLDGLTGVVVVVDANTVAIRLDQHFEVLDEWDNELIWSPDDDEFADVASMTEVVPS